MLWKLKRGYTAWNKNKVQIYILGPNHVRGVESLTGKDKEEHSISFNKMHEEQVD